MKTIFCPNPQFAKDQRPVVVFDLDGTLSDDRHREQYAQAARKEMLRPQNHPSSSYIKSLWDIYHGESFMDDPLDPGCRLYNDYALRDQHQVWIVTTRPERHKAETLRWVAEHLVEMPDRIVMRADDCYKQSFVIKYNFLAAALPFVPGGYALAVDNDPAVIAQLAPHMPTFLFNPSPKIR